MRPFSAWKVGLPYYGPLLILGIALFFFNVALGSLVLFVALAILGFFRDPPRSASSDASDIVSPADGAVVAIEELAETEHYDGPCKRVSIFLSVFNVHVNRLPYDAEIADIRYKRGKYKNAMSPESSEVNESNALWLETPFGPMTVRQISGAIARRIVCAVNVGDTLAKGEKIGMIKFGSRTELYLPVSAEICVKIKEKVKGATTVLARIPTATEDSP